MSDTAEMQHRLGEMEERLAEFLRETEGRYPPIEVRRRIDQLRARITRLRRSLTEETGVIAGEVIEVTAETAPFMDRNFQSLFEAELRSWCNAAQGWLTQVVTYSNSSEPAEGISVSDILGVVQLCFSGYPPAAAVIGAVNTIQGVVQAGYRSIRSAQPSMAQIHDTWASSLANYARGGNKRPAFEAFINDYKRRENIPANVDRTPVEVFEVECRAATQHFPSREHVQRAFLTEIVRSVPDAPLDGDDYSGVAEPHLMELGGGFTDPGGQIDDVNESLMTALTTVWGSAPVVDLPIPIYFTIDNTLGNPRAEIRRESNQPGNTRFTLHSGEQRVFDAFMSERAYNLVRVNHLTFDS